MPYPAAQKPQMNFAQIPDPDTLTPEARNALLATPWFQKIIREHQAGAEITSEYMREQANKPGASGFQIREFEFEPGKKSRGLYDIAMGEFVPPDRFKSPQFEPQIKAVTDPTTKQTSSVLMTSSNSAVPFNKAPQQAPLMQDFYKAAPIFDDKFNVISHVFAGPDGEIRTVGKGGDMKELAMILRGGEPTPGAAPAAPQPATPAPAKPASAEPAFVVKSQADYDRVPSGASYIDPNGKRRTKK